MIYTTFYISLLNTREITFKAIFLLFNRQDGIETKTTQNSYLECYLDFVGSLETCKFLVVEAWRMGDAAQVDPYLTCLD